ncbi:uncharacterized protein LOC125423788 [Ziziphus jujuba]|uniref:Uncharacterized protein LOC125423788 n=1 Tax=Ziziphus jujuba TaxID=326968 RepID=A0ABM4ADT8_ZIZJJ|nr:uncharacterized protein LOC125423788 [Ziziphus jujuba]
MKLLKDYGYTIDYHPGKAKLVVDALSRKSTAQFEDTYLMSMRRKVKQGGKSDFSIRGDEALVIGSQHYCTANKELKRKILEEVHNSACAMYPVSIISDRDPWLTSRFWQRLMKELGVKLNLSTNFHPQTDEQSKRTIQTLEDMLRSCVLQFKGNWNGYLPLAKFTYNDNYHSSIQILPYESIVCFGKQRKLSPHYIGPYKIVERIGPVVYRLDLLEELSRVHDVFHISILHKYISNPSHVLETPEIELRDDLSYEEQ